MIEETANVSYSADGNNAPMQPVSASGSADNSLGDLCVKTATSRLYPAYASESGVASSISSNRHFASYNGAVSFVRKFSASANATGGGGAGAYFNSYTVKIHAQPYAFYRFNPASDVVKTDGTLYFIYDWKSTTGNKNDLTDCFHHEQVVYPGGNPFYYPKPFNAYTDNPLVLPTINIAGDSWGNPMVVLAYGVDNHYVIPAVAPYISTTVSASQRYEFNDRATGQLNVLIPSFTGESIATIVRKVSSRPGYTGIWYSCTKQGFTSWLKLE